MSYQIAIESFEGPFDLLLSLVSEQKLDIGRVSVAEIAEQYLAYIEAARDLDMDVASDFLVVAATLLALKTEALLPESMPDNEDDFEEYTPQEARDILISRLLAYKQFKNAAAALNVRMESEGRMHARHAGPEPQFIGLLPDWLEGVTLHSLVVICADLAARRGVILLEAEHIVSRPMSLERVVELINRRLEREKSLTFSDLIKGQNDLRSIVVGFLGVLELYHRGMIDIEQADSRAEIELFYRDTDSWEPALEPSSNISPVDEYIEKLAEINEKSVQVSEENIDATIAILEEK